MKETIRRIHEKFRNHLVFQSILNKLKSVGIKIMPFYIFQEKMYYLKDIPMLSSDTATYEVVILNGDEIRYIGRNARGYSETLFSKYVKRGNLCFGLKRNNEIICFLWIDLDYCNFEPYAFKLEKTEAYIFSLYTMEVYRGKGFAPYLMNNTYKILNLQYNKDTFISVIEYFNRSSLKVKQKLNHKKLKLVLYFEFFRKFHFRFILNSY